MTDPRDIIDGLNQKLEALIKSIEAIAPYAIATLNPGLGGQGQQLTFVHRGRAQSSTKQLEALLRQAKASR